MTQRTLSPIVLASFLLSFLPLAGAEKPPLGKESDQSKKEKPRIEEKSSVTKHKGVFGGEELNYTATAGTYVLKKDEKEPRASIFYVAYTRDGVKDPATRPVVFCFNGGPGSSSVWLHLGGFGPRRVRMNADGTQPSPPFKLGDNPDSILRVADLVFIDPVSTGYSRAGKKEDAKAFHGFEGDLNSVADFIRLYTTRNERWLSAKFLAGESYGAFRVAGLTEVLLDKYGLYLNGVVLVSGVLRFDTLWGTDLSHICYLPSLSEVAAFHGKLKPELINDPVARRKQVEAFARGEYATALLMGARLSSAQKTSIARQLSLFTGLDAKLIEQLNLRIPPSRFREELLRDSGEILGRYDGRIKAKDADRAGNSPEFDPSYSTVYGAFSATLKDYLHRDLKFESDLVYEILSRRVQPWDYSKSFSGHPVDVTDKLASALSENTDLQILINCGYQDLATPYFAMEYSIDHLQVDPDLLKNFHYTFYEGGHMIYTLEKSNSAWNKDVAEFIQANSGGK